jgi:hypothetical protein
LPHPLSLVERVAPGSLLSGEWIAQRTAAGEWRVTGETGYLSISILISLQARPTEASLRISTERGTIDLDLFHGFATVDTAPVSRAAKILRPFRKSARHFGAAVVNLAHRVAVREFAYPGLRMLIAQVYEAVRTQRPAPISQDETVAVAAARDRIAEIVMGARTRGTN